MGSHHLPFRGQEDAGTQAFAAFPWESLTPLGHFLFLLMAQATPTGPLWNHLLFTLGHCHLSPNVVTAGVPEEVPDSLSLKQALDPLVLEF